MGEGGKAKTMPSKAWSCSELKEGQQKLTSIKREQEDDFDARIKEHWTTIPELMCCFDVIQVFQRQYGDLQHMLFKNIVCITPSRLLEAVSQGGQHHPQTPGA